MLKTNPGDGSFTLYNLIHHKTLEIKIYRMQWFLKCLVIRVGMIPRAGVMSSMYHDIISRIEQNDNLQKTSTE